MKFLLEATSLFKDFMNQLFYSYSEFKYTSIILSFTKKIHELIIKVLKSAIKTIDNLFAKSDYRRKNFYINKQDINRTIVDCYGELSFNRTYYTDKKWIHEQVRLNKLDIMNKKTLYFVQMFCYIYYISKKNNRSKLLNRYVFITASKTPKKNNLEKIK